MTNSWYSVVRQNLAVVMQVLFRKQKGFLSWPILRVHLAFVCSSGAHQNISMLFPCSAKHFLSTDSISYLSFYSFSSCPSVVTLHCPQLSLFYSESQQPVTWLLHQRPDWAAACRQEGCFLSVWAKSPASQGRGEAERGHLAAMDFLQDRVQGQQVKNGNIRKANDWTDRWENGKQQTSWK